MAADTAAAGTDLHRGPSRPEARWRRPALVYAFPGSGAFALPDSGTVVGRRWLAARGIEDTEVSGSHLRLDRGGGVLRIRDLGSRNGTWVNGAPLTAGEPVPLEDGALLRIGRSLFVLRSDLAGPLEPAPPLGELVGPYGLRGVAATVAALAAERPATVLVEGETGTGKELTARLLARALGRKAPFAAVNVAAVAPGVFESQLFGHVAGAFSGATSAVKGIVAAHEGGTVFFDEIGELALELQPKLLRLLDGGEILPVGADRPRQADVLVLCATNRSLGAMVAEGRFRADLYARLAKAQVRLPALRERPEDLVAIARALARRQGAELDPRETEVEAAERLLLAPWPRNVRELDGVLAAVRRVDPSPGLRLWALAPVLGETPRVRPPLTGATIEAVVAACEGNVAAAARQLGVSRGKLLRLRRRH